MNPEETGRPKGGFQPHEDLTPTKAKAGILFRWGSAWIGIHFSPKHKRFCINFLPCITFWVTLPGGEVPTKEY